MAKNEFQISRVDRSRLDAMQTYDRYSRWYDWISGQFERKYAEAGVAQLEVQHGERVLEIGFGTGHMLVALAKRVGSTGKVVGIDISRGMYEMAYKRLQKSGIADRVKIVCGDAVILPFESNTFDVVFMSFTLELFDTPDIPRLLLECQRVLRKGGRMGVVSLSKKGSEGIVTRVYEKLHSLFPKWIDCRPIYLSHVLTENGFQVVKESIQLMFGIKVEIVVVITP
ncbi:MAG: class I SAM-dependent methyltransferase [Candidatus Hermodarchaeota archaeon]